MTTETIQYDIVATFDFQFAPNFVVEHESDNGSYTETEDAQTIRATVRKSQTSQFEQSLNSDNNVITYAELY
jgi:hypothetical protein